MLMLKPLQFSRKLFSKSGRRTSDNNSPFSPSEASKHATTSTWERSQSIDSDSTLLSSNDADFRAASSIPMPVECNKVSERSYSIPGALPTREQTGVPDRASDPQGLSMLHAPDGPHVADMIFVHGLGGSSRLSWSRNKDLKLFWPKEWLPLDRDIQQARVFSFGYNASFQSSPQSGTVGIADFAKNLLYDMLYSRDTRGESLHLGRVRQLGTVRSR